VRGVGARGLKGEGERALALPTGVRGNLPLPLTPLIGRGQEVQAVSARLGAARLVTLTGTGGVGKTRLATQIAEAVAEQYADGVWFVDLAPLTDPVLVPQAAAAALGVRGEGRRPVVETLLAELGPKALLLVLDNCEHVLDAAARLADQVLARCPQVRFLATSRERLGLVGEVAWRVPPLAVPGERDLQQVEQAQPNGAPAVPDSSTLLDFAAVRLFAERAADAAPGFRPEGAQLAAISRICRRLDGVPLAIELAAARVGVIPVSQILARLDDRLHLLTGGSRTALPRQRTLRATLDWSYDLPSEAERLLFRRLSVFAGGWTLEAAETMAEPRSGIRSNEVLDLLGQLVGQSVVMVDEHNRAGAHAARYRLLETLREYGQGRLLESGEGETARRRHLDYFLGLAEEGESKRYGADEAGWLERLEVEHDNLRAALAWAIEAEETGPGLRLGGALWRLWSTRGYAGEGRRQLARLLALAGSSPGAASNRAEDGWRARALLAAGSLSLEVGDCRAARSLCEESLGLWRALGDMGGVADSLAALGETEESQGGYAAAGSLFAQGLAIRRDLGDRWGIANSLDRLGRLSYYQGDYDLARDRGEAALAIRRDLADRRGIAQSLTVLGSIASHRGDYEAARSLKEESLAISRELGDKSSIGPLLNELGDMAGIHGDYARATELLEESRAIRQEIGEPGGAANARQGLGRIALDQGDHGRAGALFEESLAVYRKLSDLRGIAWALADLGTLALRRGISEAAARHYRGESGVAPGPERQAGDRGVPGGICGAGERDGAGRTRGTAVRGGGRAARRDRRSGGPERAGGESPQREPGAEDAAGGGICGRLGRGSGDEPGAGHRVCAGRSCRCLTCRRVRGGRASRAAGDSEAGGGNRHAPGGVGCTAPWRSGPWGAEPGGGGRRPEN
jgi:predicted ATPase